VRRHRALERRAHPVLVVFADINTGQLPQLGHIQRLVKCTLVDCCFAKETKRDLIGAFVFRSKGNTGGQCDLAADNGVSAKKINFLVEHMHRPALALRATGCFSEEFRHN
jgi:hypothetical protein